jgi:hypothetical protein
VVIVIFVPQPLTMFLDKEEVIDLDKVEAAKAAGVPR